MKPKRLQFIRQRVPILSMDDFKDYHYGKRGTAKREKMERGYLQFKQEVMLSHPELFGAYESADTADEIIADIRNSRVSNRKIEAL